MSRYSKTFVILCLVMAMGLLVLSGCGKKRIYTEPVPPGAHAPADSKTPAKAEIPAGARVAKSPAADAAQKVEAAAENANEPVIHDALEEQEPVELVSDLPEEASSLSGKAGVLDDELIGFPMADGSSYDAQKFVAGHRTLPLGTKLEVTETASGNKVVVTVADRGPFEKSRVVDLSRVAAGALGLKTGDEAEVTLKVIGADLNMTSEAKPAMAEPVTSAVQAASQQKTALGEPFFVQVGAFADEANARDVLEKLVQSGLTGSRIVTGTGTMTRVQAGPFADRPAAEAALPGLREDYPASFIVIPD